jgi:hypothetical protein
MCRRRYPFKTALDIIRLDRPFANPNPGFTIQLAELESANGNIEKAIQAYKQRLKGGSITDSLIEWRNTANELHRKIDALEVKVHSAAQYTDKKDEEASLIRLVNEAEAANHRCQADRVSTLILKSAIAKAKRLIGLVEGKTLQEAVVKE